MLCPRDARRGFARGHAALRRIVAAYAGTVPEIVRVSASYGAPPRAEGLELSLSHCDEVILVAVASVPIGIDVESLDAVGGATHLADLAELTLAPREAERFSATQAGARAAAWVRWFVRKEASLKSRGLGLSDVALTDVEVLDDRTDDRTLVDFTLGDGYVGAVALRHPGALLRWKELEA